jgi:hypothetical protein
MKPIIFEYYEDGERCAILADAHSPFMAAHRDTGKPTVHHPGAVDLGPCKGGVLRITPEGKLLNPRPCVFAMTGKPDENGLAWVGLDERAAVALLKLAGAGLGTSLDCASREWANHGPRERGVEIGWIGWKWVAAWRFSWWTKNRMSGAARHAELVSFGYPHSPGALRKMLADLGLVTTMGRQP